jgi:hypothetical protein
MKNRIFFAKTGCVPGFLASPVSSPKQAVSPVSSSKTGCVPGFFACCVPSFSPVSPSFSQFLQFLRQFLGPNRFSLHHFSSLFIAKKVLFFWLSPPFSERFGIGH